MSMTWKADATMGTEAGGGRSVPIFDGLLKLFGDERTPSVGEA